MKPVKKLLVAGFLFFCCIGTLVALVSAASDCGCDAAPDGGWGAPDYSNDPSWGSSFDDLSGGGSSGTGGGGSSSGGADTGGSGSGSGDSGSGSSGSGSGSSGSDSSSSGSGSSSASTGGSSEEGMIWRMKADDLLKKASYNESLSAYNKSIGYDPYAVKAWLGKGKVLVVLENPGEAAVVFAKAIKLDPSNADTLVLLGDAQNASASYKEAVASYTRALALNPNLAGVKEKIALSEMAQVAILASPTPTVVPETPVVKARSESVGATNTTAAPITPVGVNTAPFPGILAVLGVIVTGAVILMRRKL